MTDIEHTQENRQAQCYQNRWWEYDLVQKDQRIAELEAQIPKVVTPRLEVIGMSHSCPECDAEFVSSAAKYCYNCGSKLDWEDA